MAGKTKPGKPVKGINIKLKMINDLMDVTGSAKDSWNPAEISDDMKAIAYIHDLADTWNPAQLNEALKYLGFATIDSWNPAIIEETKNKLVKYFLPTDASGNPIELNLKGAFPYEATSLKIDLLPIQDLSHGKPSPTNICPISGRNSVTLTVNGEDTEIALPQTVYGGNVDVVNGGATSDTITFKLNSQTLPTEKDSKNRWVISAILSNASSEYFGKQWLLSEHPLQYGIYSERIQIKAEPFAVEGETTCALYGHLHSVEYRIRIADTYTAEEALAIANANIIAYRTTPTELATSAEQISLLKGINVLSTDGDTINITYKAILNS